MQTIAEARKSQHSFPEINKTRYLVNNYPPSPTGLPCPPAHPTAARCEYSSGAQSVRKSNFARQGGGMARAPFETSVLEAVRSRMPFVASGCSLAVLAALGLIWDRRLLLMWFPSYLGVLSL